MTSSPDLSRLFMPRRVALVGASDNLTRIGGRALHNLVRHGYAGEIIPVNARFDSLQGIKARQSVDQLDDSVDLAILAVNAERTPDVLKQMLDQGTRSFISFAAGVADDRLSALLSSYPDVALVGPNSNGIWNVKERLIVSFGSEAERPQIADGPIAIISHSGSLGGAVARRLQEELTGTRYLVSAGNEVGLSVADYLEFVTADPDILAIALYLEGIRNGARVKRALQDAKAAGIQVVAQLSGLSRAGRLTCESHTGKVLSSPSVYRAVLQDCGVLVVDSTADLVDACRLATSPVKTQLPAVGAVGISGGMLAVIADSCDKAGLQFPKLGPRTLEALRTELPGFSQASNPADVTGAVLQRPELLSSCARAVAEDPAVDALVVGLDNKGYSRIVDGNWIPALASDVQKPIAMVLWDRPGQQSVRLEATLIRAGVAVIMDPARTGSALRAMCRSNHIDAGPIPCDRPMSPACRFTQDELETWPGQVRLAELLGLRQPMTTVVSSEVLPPLSAALVPPLVVKPLPNRVRHKSDRGLVRLGQSTLLAAQTTARTLLRETCAGAPVLIQEHAQGVEVLLSISEDPDWGPILTVGMGGKLVELIGDLSTIPLPFTTDEVRRTLRHARLWPLLEGYRGDPPADVESLVYAAVRLQDVFLASDFNEVELNPVIVSYQGNGAFMVDLLTSARFEGTD